MPGLKNRPRTDWIVIHCSKTSPHQRDTYDCPLGFKYIRHKHLSAGALEIGYHYLILRDGTVIEGRHHAVMGNHCIGYNDVSLGICMMGGVDRTGRPDPNFTHKQWAALKHTLNAVQRLYPDAEIVGHRDLSHEIIFCPSFDVTTWLSRQHTEVIHKDTRHAEPKETDHRSPPLR